MTNETSVNELREGADLTERRPTSLTPFAPPQMPGMMQVESASSALAAQAKAATEARYTMAMYNPRNWDAVRQKVLNECKRPSFAHNKSAFYKKPIGAGVEGLGIRFVEVALRCMTNVLVETAMIYEDDIKEIHRVTVTELESNLTFPMDIKVSKTVERSKVPDGVSALSVRKNSYGKDVFTIPANDDDLLNKRGALISKAIRTLGLRIIPGDLQDEAEAMIKQVRLNRAAEDPDAEAKRIVDAFSQIKVPINELTKYLGHNVSICSPSELVDLRGIYGAIKDGEATWASVMENRADNKPDDEPGDGPIINKATGEVFDIELHLDPKKLNQDGSFTKRPHRGKKAAAEKKADPLESVIAAMKAAGSVDMLAEAREEGNDPDLKLDDVQKLRLDDVFHTCMEKLKNGPSSSEAEEEAGFGGLE